MNTPYSTAFEFMAGVGSDPEERRGDDRAVWQKLFHGVEITESQREWAETIVEEYPIDELDEVKERRQWQNKLATLFRAGVSFSSHDLQFASDLINQVEDGGVLTTEQEKHLEYFVYRYRGQLRDKIIYEEPPTRVGEMLGDDLRESMTQILKACEDSYFEVKNNDEN